MGFDVKTAMPVMETPEGGHEVTPGFDLATARPITAEDNVLESPIYKQIQMTDEQGNFAGYDATADAQRKEIGARIRYSEGVEKHIMSSMFNENPTPISVMTDAYNEFAKLMVGPSRAIKAIPIVAEWNFIAGLARSMTPENITNPQALLLGALKNIGEGDTDVTTPLIEALDIKNPNFAGLLSLLPSAIQFETLTNGLGSKVLFGKPVETYNPQPLSVREAIGQAMLKDAQLARQNGLKQAGDFFKTNTPEKVSADIKALFEQGKLKLLDYPDVETATQDLTNRIFQHWQTSLYRARIAGVVPKIQSASKLLTGKAGFAYIPDTRAIQIAQKILAGEEVSLPPDIYGKVIKAMGSVIKTQPGADLKSEMAGKEVIPEELKLLSEEAKKYKTAEEFADEYSRNNTVNDVRNIVSKFDPAVNTLNQKLTGKEIKMATDVKLGLKAEKTAKMWAGATRSINAIDKKLFAETNRALQDFYNKAKLSPTEGITQQQAAQFILQQAQRVPKKVSIPRTLASEVVNRGGLDPEKLSKDYNIKEDIKESGLSRILKKGGRGLDDVAASLVEDGILQVPENMNPSDYLMEQLKGKAKMPSVKSDLFYNREYLNYVKEKADEVDVSFNVEKMDKELFKEKEKEINALLKIAGKPSLLKAPDVKKVVREVTGQTKVGELIREDEALKAKLKGEEQVSKVAFRAGKQAGVEEQKFKTAEQEANQKARDEARQEIQDLVGDINALPTQNLPLEYKDKIEEIKSGLDLKNRTAKTLARRESMKAFVERATADGEEVNIPLEQLEMLEKTSLNDMTMDELRDIHKTVTRLYHLGKLKNKLITSQDDRTFDEIKKEGIDVITKGKGLNLESTFVKNLQEQNESLKDKSVEFIKSFVAHNMRPELMINILDDFDTAGVNTRVIWDTLWEAEKGKIVESDRVITKIKEIHKDIDLGEAVRTKYDIGRFKGMTKDMAMFIYANSFNPDNRLHLEGSGITDEDISAIEQFLSATEKKAVTDMISFYDTEQWPAIEKVYSELEGVHLGKEEFYFPIDRLEDISFGKELEMSLMEKAYIRRAGVSKGMTKERVTSDKGFSEFSYFNNILRNFGKVEHYKAYAKAIRDVNKYLNNKEVKKAIQESYGETYFRILDKWLKDVSYSGNAQDRSLIDSFSKWVRTNYGISVLGLNVLSMAKQPVSFIQGAEMAGKETTMAAVGKFLSNPKEVMAFVDSKSVLIKHRAFTQERELREIIAQRGVAGQLGHTGAYQTVREKSMLPILIADRITVVCVWQGAYDGALKDGMNDKDAVNFADRVVRRTQPAGSAINLPDFFRGPEYQKLFSIFRNQPNQNFNLLLEASLKYGGGKSSGGKFANELAFYLLVPALFIGIMNRKKIPNAIEFAKDTLNGALGGVFLLGQLTGFLSSGFIGGLTPIDSYMQDAFFALNGKKLATKSKALIRFASKVSGIPFIGPYRILTGEPIGKAKGKKTKFKRNK